MIAARYKLPKSGADSKPVELLKSQLIQKGFDDFIAEYHFAAEEVGKGRGVRERLQERGWKDWRLDIYFPHPKIALEIEGGTFGRPVQCPRCGIYVQRRLANGRSITIREGGRHNTGKGHEEDCRKYNAAESLGIRVFRFTTAMIKRGEAMAFIKVSLSPQRQFPRRRRRLLIVRRRR